MKRAPRCERGSVEAATGFLTSAIPGELRRAVISCWREGLAHALRPLVAMGLLRTELLVEGGLGAVISSFWQGVPTEAAPDDRAHALWQTLLAEVALLTATLRCATCGADDGLQALLDLLRPSRDTAAMSHDEAAPPSILGPLGCTPLALSSRLGRGGCAALLVLHGYPVREAAGTQLEPMLHRLAFILEEADRNDGFPAHRAQQFRTSLAKASLLASSPQSRHSGSPDYAAQAATILVGLARHSNARALDVLRSAPLEKLTAQALERSMERTSAPVSTEWRPPDPHLLLDALTLVAFLAARALTAPAPTTAPAAFAAPTAPPATAATAASARFPTDASPNAPASPPPSKGPASPATTLSRRASIPAGQRALEECMQLILCCDRKGSGQTGSSQTASSQAGSGPAGSGQAGSGPAGSGQAGSGQAGSDQAGSDQAASGLMVPLASDALSRLFADRRDVAYLLRQLLRAEHPLWLPAALAIERLVVSSPLHQRQVAHTPHFPVFG